MAQLLIELFSEEIPARMQLGAARDFENEGLRRLVVNGVYWALGWEVPAKADVATVGEYHPSDFSFGTHIRRGLTPDDYALNPAR